MAKVKQQPFSAAAQLDYAIGSLGLRRTARNVFIDFPQLRAIALAYTRYVTPIIDLDDQGTNLLPMAIGKAITAVAETGDPGAFLGVLVETSRVLAHLKICVPNPDSHLWDIWDYDEPLMNWMYERDSSLISVTVRPVPLDEGQVILKLLANIATTRDIINARLYIDIRAAA